MIQFLYHVFPVGSGSNGGNAGHAIAGCDGVPQRVGNKSLERGGVVHGAPRDIGFEPVGMGKGSHRESAVGELQQTKESMVGEHRQRKYSRFIGT